MKIKKNPPWEDTYKPKNSYPPLTHDLVNIDVVIIGGGMAGVSTAYLLSKEDMRVALIEKANIGSGATYHTTAFLSQIIDTNLSELIEMFGRKEAKLVWQSGREAIEMIARNIDKEKIECEFTRCPYYEFALQKSDDESLKEEVELAKKMGFDVEFKRDHKLGFNLYGYIELKNQAKFHPLKYMDQLLEAAVKNGVQVFEQTEALDIEEREDIVAVKTKDGTIIAKKAIIATYAPFINTWEHYFKSAYYKDFMMELEVPKGYFKEALYADTSTPYNYFRIDSFPKSDRMIIGGLTHRVQVPLNPKKGFKALENWIKIIFPGLKYKLIRKWSGDLIETDDGLPYIGKLLGFENVMVATGFSGNGMTYSHIAAMIFRDLIDGKKNPCAALYDATRIPNVKSLIYKGSDYLQTLLGGVRKNLSQNAAS